MYNNQSNTASPASTLDRQGGYAQLPQQDPANQQPYSQNDVVVEEQMGYVVASNDQVSPDSYSEDDDAPSFPVATSDTFNPYGIINQQPTFEKVKYEPRDPPKKCVNPYFLTIFVT